MTNVIFMTENKNPSLRFESWGIKVQPLSSQPRTTKAFCEVLLRLVFWLSWPLPAFPVVSTSGVVVLALIPNLRNQDYSGGSAPVSHGIPL